MSAKTPLNKDLAIALLKRFPGEPSRALARLLYKENPLNFASQDAAYTAIRTARGAKGNARRKYASMPPSKLSIPVNHITPKLPESHEEEYVAARYDTKSCLSLADLHIPYHSVSAIESSIQWAKKRNPETILLNGDVIDLYQLSRFIRDPRKRCTKDEIDDTIQVLEYLNYCFPKARKIYRKGNHEERLETLLMTKAPELLGIADFELENILGLSDLGWEIIGEKRIIRMGKLSILHGHEYKTPMMAPVNAARGLFLRTKETCLVAHYHSTAEHSEPTLNGHDIVCWSQGCLCGLHPQYMPLNKWNQGFAYMEFDSDGHFILENKKIIEGVVR